MQDMLAKAKMEKNTEEINFAEFGTWSGICGPACLVSLSKLITATVPAPMYLSSEPNRDISGYLEIRRRARPGFSECPGCSLGCILGIHVRISLRYVGLSDFVSTSGY